ncbi:glycerophosphodiester phosphodiesterase, partial [Moniliophthora roreri]
MLSSATLSRGTHVHIDHQSSHSQLWRRWSSVVPLGFAGRQLTAQVTSHLQPRLRHIGDDDIYTPSGGLERRRRSLATGTCASWKRI